MLKFTVRHFKLLCAAGQQEGHEIGHIRWKMCLT